MFSIRNIRKIPKDILERIQAVDSKIVQTPNGNTRFYKYYTLYKNELAEVVVAVRHYHKKWYCKQVVVHGIHNDRVYLQDIGQVMGFRKIGWHREGITKYPSWYDYDWGYNEDKYFNIDAPIINKEFLGALPQYKYSAIELYNYTDIIKYLRIYEQYPQVEYLVKMKLSYLATSKTILKKIAKDKGFQKFIVSNKEDICANKYKVNSIIRAYTMKTTIAEIENYDNFKNKLKQFDSKEEMLTNFKSMKHFYDYLQRQNTNIASYNDYYKACKYLQINMLDSKNCMPKDFKYWHDVRIDEYATAIALKDAEARKELYNKFKGVAEKYLSLQRDRKENYIVIIAQSPKDLIREGELLNHCVGRMNYDQRFIREESLIFFVRDIHTPNKPLVTLEYSLQNKKILQCYGYNDSKPNQNILDYVNNKWLPYANRKLNKIQKQAVA